MDVGKAGKTIDTTLKISTVHRSTDAEKAKKEMEAVRLAEIAEIADECEVGETTPPQMGKPNPLNDLKKEDDDSIQMSEFVDALKMVEYVGGLTSQEAGNMRFHFDFFHTSGVIEIPLSKLTAGPQVFTTFYFGLFDEFPPYDLIKKSEDKKKNKWTKFLKLCKKMAVKVAPEERTEYIETDTIIDYISKFEVLTDPVLWGSPDTKRTLFQETRGTETRYLLKSSDMMEIVKDLKINTLIGTLSQHMTGRGLKERKTKVKKTRGGSSRVWVFHSRAFEDAFTDRAQAEQREREGGII